MTFPKIRALRWWVMGLLTLGAIINYLSRSTLATAAPTLFKELSITPQEYSWILNFFQAGIMLQPICGYVFELIGLKMGFAIFTVAWSLISMGHVFGSNWYHFAWLRGFLGLAEGSSNPGGMKTIAEWFPSKERGLAAGVFNIGATVGSMLAPPLVAMAILYYNWQAAFIITGVLGLIWVGFWLTLYHSPAKHPALSDAERATIAAGQETHLRGDSTRPSVGKILRERNFWGLALPKSLTDPTWSILTAWVPLYLSQVHHFDLKTLALTAWLPFLAADIGCMFPGFFVIQLQKRGVGLINARRWAVTVGALLMTSMAFVGFVANPYVAVGLMCIGGFAQQTVSVTVLTMTTDLFKRNEVATVTGMIGTCTNAGVIVFNMFVGGLLATIGYTPFFVVVGLLDLVGAVILWTFVREKRVPEQATT